MCLGAEGRRNIYGVGDTHGDVQWAKRKVRSLRERLENVFGLICIEHMGGLPKSCMGGVRLVARLERCVAWVGVSRQDRDGTGLTAPQKPPCEKKGQQQLQLKKGLFVLKNEVHFWGSFFLNTEKNINSTC